MKVFIFFIVNILAVFCQETTIPAPPVAPSADDWTVEAAWCYIGIVAVLPTKPVKCLNPNEVFSCAFGEARCNGFEICHFPPCKWRCWCKNGYKRNANGKCVKYCTVISIPDFPITK
jgi:hypothetical protein